MPERCRSFLPHLVMRVSETHASQRHASLNRSYTGYAADIIFEMMIRSIRQREILIYGMEKDVGGGGSGNEGRQE